MKRTVIAAFSALLLISPAAAQPAQPAEAAPSAHQLELARQLVQATRMDALMTDTFRGMAAQVTAAASKNFSADRQARMKVFADAEGNALAKLVPELVEAMVNGYARNFTERELSDILAFYQSPSGRSMVAKTPQFMQGVSAEMVSLIPQMRREMGQEVCAKTACTPAERAAFFGAEAAKNQPPQGSPSTPSPSP